MGPRSSPRTIVRGLGRWAPRRGLDGDVVEGEGAGAEGVAYLPELLVGVRPQRRHCQELRLRQQTARVA